MEINSAIKTVLEESGIDYQDGLTYLLSIYYDTYPNYIPNDLKVAVNATKIVILTEEGVTWQIPLFAGENIGKFDWVISEYLELFKRIGKGTHSKECILRMKKLFSENPDIRKEEVINATRLYLESTNIKFVRMPHYFILKGSGFSKSSDLLAWIETYREEMKQSAAIRDETRKLQ